MRLMAQLNGLDSLLAMDGVKMFYGERYWVGFEVKLVSADVHIPHGIKYSLTLHDRNQKKKSGTRIMGFDNAHGIDPEKKYQARNLKWDHFHNKENVSYYDFEDCYQLMNDFWDNVKKTLVALNVDFA